MKLTEVTFGRGLPIEGYGPGFFRIAGAVHRGAVLIVPEGVLGWGGFDDTAGVLGLAGQIDVLFVGTGPEIAPIPAEFRAPLEAAGVGVEIMNTPAACRSHNVCLAEGRRIAAALLPV
ncbi:MAG: Mth938-like domain-containing protein [Gemmobacter sp.]